MSVAIPRSAFSDDVRPKTCRCCGQAFGLQPARESRSLAALRITVVRSHSPHMPAACLGRLRIRRGPTLRGCSRMSVSDARVSARDFRLPERDGRV